MSDLEKWPLERFYQKSKSIFRYVMYVTPNKLHAKKIRKFTEARVSQIDPPPPSNLTDGQTDNSAFRLAELKSWYETKKLVWNDRTTCHDLGVSGGLDLHVHVWETPNDLGQSTTLDPPLP